MRVVPTITHCCHLCGSAFTVHNRVTLHDGNLVTRSDPAMCPRCDARIRKSPAIDAGAAKGPILAEAGTPATKREYGSPAAYLSRRCLTEGDVDAIQEHVRGMDYDAWEAFCRKLQPQEPKFESEAKIAARLREAAPQLFDRLQHRAVSIGELVLLARSIGPQEVGIAVVASEIVLDCESLELALQARTYNRTPAGEVRTAAGAARVATGSAWITHAATSSGWFPRSPCIEP